jgi:hypothetical protein
MDFYASVVVITRYPLLYLNIYYYLLLKYLDLTLVKLIFFSLDLSTTSILIELIKNLEGIDIIGFEN